MQYAPVRGWVYAGYSILLSADDFMQQMGLCRIHLSADGFMQDTPVSREFMQDSPVSRWVYAGYSCQQLGLCRILLSADGLMQYTPVSRWVNAVYSR